MQDQPPFPTFVILIKLIKMSPSKKSKSLIIGIVSGFTLFVFITTTIQYWPSNRVQQKRTFSFFPPQPTSQGKFFYADKKRVGEPVPEEWIERTHKTAPGDDWKSIEANSINELTKSQLGYLRSTGTWVERGPSNIPGRITDIDIDYENEHIYSLSDHGIVFRSDLNGNDISAKNDQFPLALGTTGQLKHFEGSGANLICAGWIRVLDGWGVYHSNDGGQDWTQSSGFPINDITGIRRISTAGDTAYLFVQEYDSSIPSDFYRVYTSSDNGANFTLLYESAIPAGDGGRHRKSDMWVSNDPELNEFYLLLEDSLYTVNKGTGARNFETLISGNSMNQALLTGLTKNGVTQLRVYEEQDDVGKFYSWSTADPTPQFQGQLTAWFSRSPFGYNSFTCSAISADTLYFGSIITNRSTDGGQTWVLIDHDPTESYALYHGDVPKTLSLINPSTQEEEFYMGTDGGLYRWDTNADSFDSLAIPGLNCTQLYKMVSEQAAPGTMYIGTQDNGYSHTTLGSVQANAVDFTFEYGGDVTNVVSGDGGESFWLFWIGGGCNYMLDSTNATSNFSPDWSNGAIPYWEPPAWVSNHFPDRCYTAGYLNNGSGSHIIELIANPGEGATATEMTTDFETLSGARIATLAISPLDSNYFYVATENGYFYSSSDGGNSWSSSTLISNSFYAQEILPSKINLGEVWIGGSGYSNAPVYYSSDHGNSFTAFDIGMLPCRVHAFATNEDETTLYAASSIGPYEYEIANGQWENIAGTTAPINEYMDVEYIVSSSTVRFATYARGIWDYQLMTTLAVNSLANKDLKTKVYPNPANEIVQIEVDDHLLNRNFRIVSVSGNVLKTGSLKSKITEIHIADLSSGMYFINIENYANQSFKFFKK